MSSILWAGPKGDVIVKSVPGPITIDGNFSDWQLSRYTTPSRQPPYPDARDATATNASGDHIVWEASRVSGFNTTDIVAFGEHVVANPTEFGVSTYFAYDAQNLYVLSVYIDDFLQSDRDENRDLDCLNFFNDGFEIFIDAKGDSLDQADEISFPNFDEEEPNLDDMQITFALHDSFPSAGPLGARQHMERSGTPTVICSRDNEYRAVLGDENNDIGARAFDDLRAAGATNPELAANPNTTFAGYAIEARVPFGIVDGFAPDHNMGFDIFWRDVDDVFGELDPGTGGSSIVWTDWTQNDTVQSQDDGVTKIGLFHTANWGELIFESQGNPCDFNRDGKLDVADVDLLRDAVRSGQNSATFDVTKDGLVNTDDIVSMLESADKLNSYVGDADLDGQFNTADFVAVFIAGQYEDTAVGNSTWATGDWNGDGEFATSDLVLAFQRGGYEAGPRPNVQAVPEPACSLLVVLAVLGLTPCWRRPRAQ
jgi:hypothetical protein